MSENEVITFGRYEVRGRVGAGGMGVVLRAWDPQLEREVAIKLVPPHLRSTPTITERFRREAITLARLSHPNIVRVFDVGEEQGSLFYVMELLEGQGLDRRTKIPEDGAPDPEPPPFDWKEFLGIFLPLADALATVHKHGIVHRDIKPANILAGVPERGAVLTDFGLTLITDDEKLTQEGMIMGTAHYMAPEQARGEPADAVADVYSLGASMYEFATGRIPFWSIRGSTLLAARMMAELAPVKRMAPAVPDAIATVIDRCVRADRNERLGSAKDLTRGLSRAKRLLEDPNLDPAALSDSGTVAAARSRGSMSGLRSAAIAAPVATVPLATEGGGRRALALLAGALFLAAGTFWGWRHLSGGGPPAKGPVVGVAPAAATRPASAGAGEASTGAAATAVLPSIPRPKPEQAVQLSESGEVCGHVALAASGDRILVVWARVDGRLAARLSPDRGWHWTRPPCDGKLLVHPTAEPALKAANNRFHLLYTTGLPSRRTLVLYTSTGLDCAEWQPSSSLGHAQHPGCWLKFSAGEPRGGSIRALAAWEPAEGSLPALAWGDLMSGRWMAQALVPGSKGRGRFTALVDRDGSGLVAWEEDTDTVRTLFSSSCAGPGEPWTPSRRMEIEPPGYSRSFPLALLVRGQVCVAYGENQLLTHPIVLGVTTDRGLTVRPASYVERPYARDSRASLVAHGKSVWALFRRQVPDRLVWNRSPDAGLNWKKARLLCAKPAQIEASALLAVSPSEAWAVFVDVSYRVFVVRLP